MSEALINDNRRLVELLIKKDAQIFHDHGHNSNEICPFYQAVNHNKQWAIELFCDHGVQLDDVNHNGGINPLIYAATRGHNEIAMYLSLRVKDINVEDQTTGHNIFTIYMLKKDIFRM